MLPRFILPEFVLALFNAPYKKEKILDTPLFVSYTKNDLGDFDLEGVKVGYFLEAMLGNRRLALSYLEKLDQEGEVILQGRFDGQPVQYYLITEKGRSKNLRGAIIKANDLETISQGSEYLTRGPPMLKSKNPYPSGQHLVRLNLLAKKLAESAGLPEEQTRILATYSQLHDVGQVYYPNFTIKESALTEKEKEMMKQHPLDGAKIIGSDFPEARNIALYHHEWWNGTGYPEGLAGEQIPLSARIVAVVDVYDALRSPRAYKEPFSHEEALRVMNQETRHFDPVLLQSFLAHDQLFRHIYDSLADRVRKK